MLTGMLSAITERVQEQSRDDEEGASSIPPKHKVDKAAEPMHHSSTHRSPTHTGAGAPWQAE